MNTLVRILFAIAMSIAAACAPLAVTPTATLTATPVIPSAEPSATATLTPARTGAPETSPSAAETEQPARAFVVGTLVAGAPALDLTMETTRQWLWVRTATGVTLFDIPTGNVLATRALPGTTTRDTGIAFDPWSGWLFTTDATGRLYVLEADLAAVIATVPIPGTPGSVAIDLHTHMVFVVDEGVHPSAGGTPRHGAVHVVDPSRTSVVAVVSVPGYPFSAVVNSATGRVYVSGEVGPGGSAFVQVIDGDTKAELGVIGTSLGTDIASDDAANWVFMPSAPPPSGGLGKLTSIDGRNNRAQTFVNFSNPAVAGLDPSRRHIYLDSGAGLLTVAAYRTDFGSANGYSGSQVAVPTETRAITVDGLRHRVYVLAASGVVTVLRDDYP